MTSAQTEAVRRRFVEAAGSTTQSLGFGRVIGQIFAHLYLSREPQSLDDLARVLGISKGSASMCVRQLEQWDAVHHVWVKGDRKDYYEAKTDFGRIVRRVLLDVVGRKMETADALLNEMDEMIAANGQDSNGKFMASRVRNIRKFRGRAQWIWDRPILQKLLLKK